METEGIHRVRKKRPNGEYRYYYYSFRGGKQFWKTDGTPLEEPYPKAFYRALKRAFLDKPHPIKPNPGTLDRAIDDYMADEVFLTKTKATRKTYETYIPAIKARFGSAKLEWFERPKTREMIYSWRNDHYSDRERSGDLAVTTLTLILNWCVDRGRIQRHVAGNMRRKHKTDRSSIIWLQEEVEALMPHLPNENSRRLVRFAALSGLRRGDICKLSPSADKGDWIDVMTSKKKVGATVPVTSEMREIIDWFNRERQKRPHAPLTLFFNSRMRPYTPDGLSSIFMRARDAAGIKKRFHDLKGTACTHYNARGFSNEEIARFVGWKKDTVDEIIHTYVAKSAMVKSAITRLKAV